jgi:anaerobic magnesium-protoporphyrin IX monomethyl ester cyclase
MHVTLLRPPTVTPPGVYLASRGTPPLGLAYLAGAVKAAGFDVTCIDAFAEKMDGYRGFGTEGLVINGLIAQEIVDRVPFDTHVIGISCMYSNEWIYVREVIHSLHENRPDAVLIAGGEHVTADYAEVFADTPELTACALGEGEETLVATLEALQSAKPLRDVAGLVIREPDGTLVHTGRRPRIKEISAIPRPAWQTIPIEKYLNAGLGFGAQGRRAMPILASRGCPYQCTFCSSPQMWTTKWSCRDVEDVLDEMKTYIRLCRAEHFDFYDLTAIIRKDWIVAFATRLIEERWNITWALPSGTRSEALTADVLQLLRASGCCKINYAPESGSEPALVRIKKRVKLDRMIPSMRAAVKAGIITRANILIGLPEQDLRELIDNFAFAARLAWIGLHDIAVFGFVPYPGSEIYRQLRASGQIESGEAYRKFLAFNLTNAHRHMRSWSRFIPDWQMPYIIYALTAWFYGLQFVFRPYRALIHIYRMAIRKPITTFEIIVSTFIGNCLRSGKHGNSRELPVPGVKKTFESSPREHDGYAQHTR